MATLGGLGGGSSSSGGSQGLQIEFFTVPNGTTVNYALYEKVAKDRDGDSIISVFLNGQSMEISIDYTLVNDQVVNWSSQIPLETGDKLEVRYQPV